MYPKTHKKKPEKNFTTCGTIYSLIAATPLAFVLRSAYLRVKVTMEHYDSKLYEVDPQLERVGLVQ